MDAANYVFRTIPHRDQLTLRTLYRLFVRSTSDHLVGKVGYNLIDATLVTASDAPPRAIQTSQNGDATCSAAPPTPIQDHRQGLAEADYRYNWSDIRDEIQATYKGLVTLFPRMEQPVGMIAPGRREACRVSDSNYFIGTSRSASPPTT